MSKKFLKEWPSLKAKRRAFRQARGMSQKSGRHEERFKTKEVQLSIAIQKEVGVKDCFF
jgi:hypothetical protein